MLNDQREGRFDVRQHTIKSKKTQTADQSEDVTGRKQLSMFRINSRLIGINIHSLLV